MSECPSCLRQNSITLYEYITSCLSTDALGLLPPFDFLHYFCYKEYKSRCRRRGSQRSVGHHRTARSVPVFAQEALPASPGAQGARHGGSSRPPCRPRATAQDPWRAGLSAHVTSERAATPRGPGPPPLPLSATSSPRIPGKSPPLRNPRSL